MRYVFTHRTEAKERGRQARADIVKNYSQEKVAEIVLDRLKKIETKLKKE
jgi:hypothetical protein